jgi:alpha-beta hydrolase superfamily lysophospholipase
MIDLVISVWEPKGEPRSLLYFAHGLNGHAGNMGYFLKQCSLVAGVVAFGMDYRNFGRSGGKDRGLVGSVTQLVEDTELVLNWARKKYGEGLKIFLIGLSMGGAISIKVANRANVPNIAGVIFVSPVLRMNKFSPLPLSLIHYFKIIFMPRSYISEPNYTSGCRHKQFINKIKADKNLYHGNMRAGTARAIGMALRNIWDDVFKFTLPYLFIQGGVDKSVDPFIIVDFEQDSKSKDKTHFFAKDMWHSACFD